MEQPEPRVQIGTPNASSVDQADAKRLICRKSILQQMLAVFVQPVSEVEANALHRQRSDVFIQIDGVEVRLQHQLKTWGRFVQLLVNECDPLHIGFR